MSTIDANSVEKGIKFIYIFKFGQKKWKNRSFESKKNDQMYVKSTTYFILVLKGQKRIISKK